MNIYNTVCKLLNNACAEAFKGKTQYKVKSNTSLLVLLRYEFAITTLPKLSCFPINWS